MIFHFYNKIETVESPTILGDSLELGGSGAQVGGDFRVIYTFLY